MVTTPKTLESLLDEGTPVLNARKESIQHKAEARSARIKAAEDLAMALIRQATDLTEAEFAALEPYVASDDDSDYVVLNAHGYNARLYLTVSRFLDLEEGSTAEVVEYPRSYDSPPINRKWVAEWLSASREIAEMCEFERDIQEQRFTPFVWYRVWYGHDEADHYDLRNLPRFSEGQFGMTVDEPFTLVFVPNPIRIEQMAVGSVRDLPAWCKTETIYFRGQERHIRVPPTWAFEEQQEDLP